MKSIARAADRDGLLARLRHVTPDAERRWGQMSSHQMICHLGDAFRMAMGTKAVSPASTLAQRTFLKYVALYGPLPWPPGIETMPEIDQARGGTCPTAFAADVAELISMFDRFVEARDCSRWPAHPYFGRLTCRQWMRWGYLHVDHHLRQFGA